MLLYLKSWREHVLSKVQFFIELFGILVTRKPHVVLQTGFRELTFCISTIYQLRFSGRNIPHGLFKGQEMFDVVIFSFEHMLGDFSIHIILKGSGEKRLRLGEHDLNTFDPIVEHIQRDADARGI